MTKIYFETAESVCKGHPDKLCDYLSDCVLDACLKVDASARVACEVLATKGQIIVAGEISCEGYIDISDVIDEGLSQIGYDPMDYQVQCFMKEQSPDIASGVNSSLEQRKGDTDNEELGAGDQGTMVGYATNENSYYLPTPLVIANQLCQKADQVRESGDFPELRPDGKAQVTMKYLDQIPLLVDTVVMSLQHQSDIHHKSFERKVRKLIIDPVLAHYRCHDETQILINPSGQFILGGPEADTGLTGRKLMVDTYGGLVPHGGGAFSGKDLTKVDRLGAYMARYLAKNVVFGGLANRCLVKLSYAIGKAEPVMVSVETDGMNSVSDQTISKAIQAVFKLTPQGMIEELFKYPFDFKQTAHYGHFTDSSYPWEQISDKLQALITEVKRYEHPTNSH
ncbi:methionine adenosyltransferase [Hutsoniella sourekii]|uniref:methionine adenosyltransferase n=1 Tax=Hutsoniella sourekii TaxID=87650 RepID=UPI0004833288|nr:methionine adenosyltransferase [Hutsoniella sourekii]